MREFEMIYRDEVSSKAVTIYRYLRDRQGKHENCFPSHQTIALDNKCSVSTVKRAIDELVKKGYVVKENRRRKNGGKTNNVYICK
ncbi:MAG: helix-turn-helix domain-containing protein [Clostridia bacterium]|nr:helix-turn-helix domain-containing protein [Clostridia bacterium]